MINKLIKRFEYIPPKTLTKILSGFLWEGTPEANTLALTFDDGPDPVITPAVLDALDKSGSRGTFFMLGGNVAKYPDIAASVSERGHLIGNHSMTHRKMFFMKRNEVEREIDETQKVIFDSTGQSPKLFRPPYGMFDCTCAHVVKQKGLSMVLWTVLSGDYSDYLPNTILKTVKPFIRPGSIIVFHDTPRGSGSALPELIREIVTIARSRNVRLGNINELSISSVINTEGSHCD